MPGARPDNAWLEAARAERPRRRYLRWGRLRLSHVVGRLLTSPLAFFVAFVIDMGAWGLRELT
ncbi:MAG: hypothetical protein ACTHQQ_22135, partial [Solirubrobacteraceae bacterium]